MKKTILIACFFGGLRIAFCIAILFGCFSNYSAPTVAAVTDLPAVVASLPKVGERTVTRFNSANFERLRHRQLALGATFMPSCNAVSGGCFGGSACGGNSLFEPMDGTIIYEGIDEGVQSFDADSVIVGTNGVIRGQVCYASPSCGLLCGGLFYGSGELWFQNYGDFLNQQNRNGFRGYDVDTYGFNFGYDFGSSPQSLWGIALGGAFSDVELRDTDQTMDTDSFLIALYGARANAFWNLMGSVGYIHTAFNTERHHPAASDLLTSDHFGNTVFGSFELSTALFQSGLSVSPFLGLDIVGMKRKEFAEEGRPGWEVAKNTHWSYLQSLGLRFERSYYAMGGWLVNPSLSVAWLHDYGSRHITINTTSTGGGSYKFKSAPQNKNRFALTVNISASLQNHTSVFLRYDGEFNRRYSAQTAQLGLGLNY